MNHGSSGLLLLALFFLISVYLLPLYPETGSERDLLNWAATVSLVENTTFDVSGTEKIIGRRFEHVKRIGDAVYPESAPGFAIASAPIYAMVRLIVGKAGSGNLKTSWFVLRLALSTFPLLILAFWLFSSEVDAYSLGALLFATPLFPFSLIYSNQVFVAVLVYLAFRVIFDFDRVMPGRCFTAGLFLGFCLLCEPLVVLPITVFFIGLLFTGRRDLGRRLLFYVAGVVPFASVLAFYSWYVLGSVSEALPPVSIEIPDLYRVYEVLFSPARGLFAFSPLLLFSILAVVTSRAGGTLRFRIKYLLIFSALLFAVFASESGTGYLFAGTPLIFLLPVFLDPLFDGEADEYSSLWRGFFFAASLLMCSIPAFSQPFAPSELLYPHNSFWEPLIFVYGAFAPTALGLFGIKGSLSAILPAAVIVLILFAVLRAARYPARFGIGILAGVLLIGNYLFFTDLESGKAEPYLKSAAVDSQRQK